MQLDVCMYNVHDRLRFRFINQCNRKMTNQEAYHASIDLFWFWLSWYATRANIVRLQHEQKTTLIEQILIKLFYYTYSPIFSFTKLSTNHERTFDSFNYANKYSLVWSTCPHIHHTSSTLNRLFLSVCNYAIIFNQLLN